MKKTFVFIIASLFISGVLTAYSLNYMDYSMVSDEGAVAYWGFPFRMISSDRFYGGTWGSKLLGEDGREYVLRVIKLRTNRNVDWIGVTQNMLFYNFANLAGLIVLKAIRNFFNKVIEFLTKSDGAS